ncbi:hypothetical protein ACLOJK_021056 [Asimina triloba]
MCLPTPFQHSPFSNKHLKSEQPEKMLLPPSLLLLVLLLSHLLLSSHSLAASTANSPSDPIPKPNVYDALRLSGLPAGLLPDSVVSYSVSNDGSFVVQLQKPCYIEFEYLVYYERRITGNIHYGSISNLKGIQVRRFLLWFDVDEIRVDLPPSDYIYFEVGWITKKLKIAQFQKVRSCGDGVSSRWERLVKGLSLSLTADNMDKNQESEWLEAQKIFIGNELIDAAKQQLQFLAGVDRNRYLYDDIILKGQFIGSKVPEPVREIAMLVTD